MATAASLATAQKLYIAFYQRPADPAGLVYWASMIDGAKGNLDAALAAFSSAPEATTLYGTIDATTIDSVVTKIYDALFGRVPSAAEVKYWADGFKAGTFSAGKLALQILDGAQGADAVSVANKVQVANSFSAAVDGRALTDPTFGQGTAFAATYAGDADATAARTYLKGVTSSPSTVGNDSQVKEFVKTTIADATDPIKGATTGQSFTLTKGLDNITGTTGDDTIIGSSSATADLNTISALDIVNGGNGTDTLKISDETGTIVLPSLSNVEIIEISGTAGVTVDTSATTGVTNLNIVKQGTAAVAATAGATTNVAVALAENGTGSVLANKVDGGNNVSVTFANAGATSNPDTITIGNTTAPKGDVVVSVTGKAYDASVADILLGAVTTNGGKTVSVTQVATSSNSAAAADTTANKVVQGAVTVNANTDTTTVTVKQDAAVAAKNAANTTGGVTETATVKFGVLKNGDVLAANGLTFTAKADMTAAEVASAFSNLVTGLANAGTDTQGSGLSSKGTYTGAFTTTAVGTTAGFTAAAASGDTVVFTAARQNQDATDLSFTLTNTSGNSVAPTVTTVQGAVHSATPAGGRMGIDAGTVTVGGGATATAVKTVSVDGYSATGSGITATTSALETLNLSNGGDFAVAQSAATLALKLSGVGTAAVAETLTSAAVAAVSAVIDLNSSATKTLNVTSTGTNTVDLQFDGATGITTLNVNGTGLLNAAAGAQASGLTTIKVSETAGLTLNGSETGNITSVDTTGTTGAVTLVVDGGKATYAGGAGKDSVTIGAVTTAFNKTFSLGAGDDTLNLQNGANTAAVLKAITTANALTGGDGTDTIALTAANAVALSADTTFAGKMDGFEKLSIDKATVAGTVNLANLDSINYVVSANSDSIVGTATKEVITVDFATSGTIVGADTVAFDGTTLTLAGGETPAQIATAFYGKTFTNWDVTSVGGTVVTLTRKVAGDFADVTGANFTIVDAGATGTMPAVVVTTTTQGAAAPATAAALTLDKMSTGGTLELTAIGAGAIVKVTDAATGTADVLNVVTKANGNVGTVTAANVETMNVTVNNALTSFTGLGFNNADGIAVKTADVSTTTLALVGSTQTTAVTVAGAGNLTLDISGNTKITSVNASNATGVLTLAVSGQDAGVTVTGGSGKDVLSASTGTNGRADVLIGGDGADKLNSGSNGVKLTGGAGDDLFVVTASSKEANTYTSILDFKAGDVLELNVVGGGNIGGLAKLTAVLNENTSTFSNFVDAAIAQAASGSAVWFQFKGNAYIAIDNTAESVTFENGVDTVVELVGVDLANSSLNTTHMTVALI